jgi:hypothetical protein
MSSITLNEKGAIAFKSTFSPLVDLFGIGTIDWNEITFPEFKKIVEMCQEAYHFDPNTYVSLLKYRRSIKHLGQKMMYFVMLSVLRSSDEYSDILEWSHACKKDLLRLARIFRYFKHFKYFKSSIPPELVIIAKELHQLIDFTVINITNITNITNVNTNNSDLIFKYLGTGHFDVENKLIKTCLNQIRESHQQSILTNSQLRHIYSSEKQKLHLFDRFLQGFKEDGTPLVIYDQEYVASYLQKMSTIAFQRACKTISLFEDSDVPYQKMLYQAFCIIQDKIRRNKFIVKTSGLNPVEQCFLYSTQDSLDIVLEGTLTSKLESIRVKDDIDIDIDIVIDTSVSMTGTPFKTALYIALMMTRLFPKTSENGVIFFNTTAKRIYPTQTTWLDSIKSLYKKTYGSTNLQSIYPYLENNSNVTLILTDGDCDPTTNGHNPFQEALNRFPNRRFIVWNLKETTLHFPYCIFDSRVGYFCGNEPSVISAVFRLLANGSEISPMTLLKESISNDEFKYPKHLNKEDIEDKEDRMTTIEMEMLFKAIKKNIPK